MESNSVLQLIRVFCPPREKNAFTLDSSLLGESGHLPGSTEKLIDRGPKAGLDMPGLQAGTAEQKVGQCVTSATKALHYYKLWRTKEGKMVLKDSEMHVSMPSSDPLVTLSSDNWQTEEGKKEQDKASLDSHLATTQRSHRPCEIYSVEGPALMVALPL